MKYIYYNALAETYTVPELCELFEMTKEDLKAASEAYNMKPVRNERGVPVFNKFQVRRLHNELYKAERSQESKEDDLWA